MTMHGSLPKRYAKALLSLAVEAGQVDKIGKDLNAIAAAWSSSKELRDVFFNPQYRPAVRHGIVKDLCTRLGASQMLDNTLRLLSDRHRMRYVAEIAAAFDALAEERAGRVRAEVSSATPLSDAYCAELARTLEAVTGRKVDIVRHVDAALIAGVVTRVGDMVFDGSVKNRLDELRQRMLEDPRPTALHRRAGD